MSNLYYRGLAFVAVALFSGCSAAIEPFPLTEVRLLNTSIQSRYERLNQKYLLDMLDPDSLLWSFRKVRHCAHIKASLLARVLLKTAPTPSTSCLADCRPTHAREAVRGLVGGEEHVYSVGRACRSGLTLPDGTCCTWNPNCRIQTASCVDTLWATSCPRYRLHGQLQVCCFGVLAPQQLWPTRQTGAPLGLLDIRCTRPSPHLCIPMASTPGRLSSCSRS